MVEKINYIEKKFGNMNLNNNLNTKDNIKTTKVKIEDDVACKIKNEIKETREIKEIAITKETKDSKEIKEIKETKEIVDMENLKDEYLCNICLNILVKPVTTKCLHHFCSFCFESYFDSNVRDEIKCPVCRKPIEYNPKKDELVVNKNNILDKKIHQFFPKEYEQRFNTIQKDLLKLQQFVKIRISYGNTYRLVPNAKPSRTNPKVTCEHGYNLFVKVLNTKSSKYIKKVKYELHPTYKVWEYEITQEPFELSRIAWGYFNVPITIFLQKPYQTLEGKDNFTVDHLLIFEEGGDSKEKVIRLMKQ